MTKPLLIACILLSLGAAVLGFLNKGKLGETRLDLEGTKAELAGAKAEVAAKQAAAAAADAKKGEETDGAEKGAGH